MFETYAGRNLKVKGDLRPMRFPHFAGCRTICGMTESRNYLAKWRKFRGLTQMQVLDRLAVMEDDLLPKTGASLSRLENGKQPYSQRVLEALAEIYDCEPADLIGRDPDKEGKVIDLVHHMTKRQLDQAIAILEALSRAG